jgi:uncharacterized SAM-binding protein YcdF (DUF218 family)
MSRMVLSRSLVALILVLGLGLLSPAWAAGRPSSPPARPAPAAAPHAGAVEALRSWVQSVLAKLVPGSGGKPAGVDAGASDDPNG